MHADVYGLFREFVNELEERANALREPDLALAKIKLKSTAVQFQVTWEYYFQDPHWVWLPFSVKHSSPTLSFTSIFYPIQNVS